MTKRLWLVRHAESEANAGLPTLDPVGIRLTPKGLLQAEVVAASLPRADQVMVSPFTRTAQTASPYLATHPNVLVRLMAIEEFTYLEASRFVNTTQKQREPAVAEYWRRLDPYYRDGESSESYADLMGRVDGLLVAAELADGLTIAFTHGKFMQALLQRVLNGGGGDPLAQMKSFVAFSQAHPVPNTAIIRLTLSDGPRGEAPWVASEVDASHLGSLG